jgi:hypothetical protein
VEESLVELTPKPKLKEERMLSKGLLGRMLGAGKRKLKV